jgi:hypothetical protein
MLTEQSTPANTRCRNELANFRNLYIYLTTYDKNNLRESLRDIKHTEN